MPLQGYVRWETLGIPEVWGSGGTGLRSHVGLTEGAVWHLFKEK